MRHTVYLSTTVTLYGYIILYLVVPKSVKLWFTIAISIGSMFGVDVVYKTNYVLSSKFSKTQRESINNASSAHDTNI